VAPVILSLLYSLRFVVRSRASLHLEILALRHQLTVVNRSRRQRPPIDVGRPDAVGVALASLARVAVGSAHRKPGDRRRVAPTRLSPLLDLEKSPPYGTTERASRRSRADPRAVERESALGCASNPRRTAEVGRHPHPPSQAWRTFLANHASQIMAADLFVVPTVTFRLLFALVILGHDRRRIVHVAVTDHPTAAWSAQQLRNVFPEDHAPRYLLHDRDGAFAAVATTVAGMNIRPSARRRARRGRTPTWSALSVRFDASASSRDRHARGRIVSVLAGCRAEHDVTVSLNPTACVFRWTFR
jgi:putative transposase